MNFGKWNLSVAFLHLYYPTHSFTVPLHHNSTNKQREGLGMEIRRGSRVRANTDIDYEPYAAVKLGDIGTVIDIHSVPEGIEVRWDHVYQGLRWWDNVTFLAPDAIEFLSPALELKPKVSRWRLAELAFVGACMVMFTSVTVLGKVAADYLDIAEAIPHTLVSMWERPDGRIQRVQSELVRPGGDIKTSIWRVLNRVDVAKSIDEVVN